MQVTEPSKIIQSFYEFFVSVGANLASTLSESLRAFEVPLNITLKRYLEIVTLNFIKSALQKSYPSKIVCKQKRLLAMI